LIDLFGVWQESESAESREVVASRVTPRSMSMAYHIKEDFEVHRVSLDGRKKKLLVPLSTVPAVNTVSRFVVWSTKC